MEQLSTLVTSAMQKDSDAFCRIYEMKRQEAYYTAVKILGDPQEAADATQEAFLQAFRDIGSLKNPDAFNGWFYRIVVNTCNRFLKKVIDSKHQEDFSQVAHMLPDTNEEFSPSRWVEKKMDRQILLDAIDSLSEKQKTAVILFYYQQMSYADIAYATGTSVIGVESRLRRAKAAIKKSISSLVDDRSTISAMLAAPVFTSTFVHEAQTFVAPEMSEKLREGIQTIAAAVTGATVAGSATGTGAAVTGGLTAKAVAGAVTAIVVVGAGVTIAARSFVEPPTIAHDGSSSFVVQKASIPQIHIPAELPVRSEVATSTPQVTSPKSETRSHITEEEVTITHPVAPPPSTPAPITSIEDMIGADGARWLAHYKSQAALSRRGELSSFLSAKGFALRAQQEAPEANFFLYTLEIQDKRIVLIERVPSVNDGYAITYSFENITQPLPESWELLFTF